MPLPGFLSSFADKAQNAIKDSPLSQHMPSSFTGATPTDSGSNQKNLTLGQLQHQFRQFQQTYSTTPPVQKIITAEKGVTLDFESLSRDNQAQSKELYTWGQTQQPDVKDVSDRLAFLNYVAGSLSSTLAAKLNTARVPLKALRGDEVALTQKRNVRAGIQNQIARLEHSQEKGNEKHIVELKAQLAKAEKDDEPAERAHTILVRKALKESEQEKFQALRVRSSPFSPRQPMLFLLFCHLSPHHQINPTSAQRRRAPSVLPCSIHWTNGNPAKRPSLCLPHRNWIAPTRRASA